MIFYALKREPEYKILVLFLKTILINYLRVLKRLTTASAISLLD